MIGLNIQTMLPVGTDKVDTRGQTIVFAPFFYIASKRKQKNNLLIFNYLDKIVTENVLRNAVPIMNRNGVPRYVNETDSISSKF